MSFQRLQVVISRYHIVRLCTQSSAQELVIIPISTDPLNHDTGADDLCEGLDVCDPFFSESLMTRELCTLLPESLLQFVQNLGGENDFKPLVSPGPQQGSRRPSLEEYAADPDVSVEYDK